MKDYLYLFLIIILFGCNAEEETNNVPAIDNTNRDELIISGTVINPKGNFVVFSGNDLSDTAKLDENNSFSIEFEISKDNYYTFNHGGEESLIYLEKGDSMSMSIDTEMFDETIEFQGKKGGDRNNYMAQKYLIEEQMLLDQQVFERSKDHFTQELMILMDGYYTKFKKNLERLSDDDLFYKREKSNIELRIAEETILMVMYDLEDSLISFRKDRFLKLINEPDSIALASSGFWRMAQTYVDYFAYREFLADNDALTNSKEYYDFKIIEGEVTNEEVKSELLFKSLYNSINTTEGKMRDSLTAHYKENYGVENDHKKIDLLYSYWEKSKNGKQAQEMYFEDIDGHIVALSDLRGKYLYINFWAYWNSKSIKMFPAWRKLKEKYEGENILFVSVTAHRNKEAWRATVKREKFTGTLLFIDNNDRTLKDEYFVTKLPRFVLIDPEGKFVDVSAPAPMWKAEELLDTLR